MENQPMIEQLKKMAEMLRTKVEMAEKSLSQDKEDLRSLLGTVSFYERSVPMREIAKNTVNAFGQPPQVRPALEVNILKLEGLSHRQAVIAIARFNGGVVRAQEAKRLMIRAGVMRDTKNATHMVHNAIISSERFERIGRGEYRLKPVVLKLSTQSGTPVAAMAAGLFPPKNPVQ